MKTSDKIARSLHTYLDGNYILEVACGDSEFSLSASKYAEKILTTDISLERFNRKRLKGLPENIIFEEMDAAALPLNGHVFDVSVCYNALGHLENILEKVLKEMIRVTKKDGYILFIATWAMDKKVLVKIKDMVSDNDLKIHDDIKNSIYSALILKPLNSML